MDISKKVIFKTFYNQYSEISEKDNQDIYLLRSQKKKKLVMKITYIEIDDENNDSQSFTEKIIHC